MEGEVRHPLFARFFHRFAGMMERELGEHRDELLTGLTGRVLEIGAGNGMNFRHYPATVDEVIALEPEPYLRSKAEEAARDAPVGVEVRAGTADPLPLEDSSVDGVVSSLVLCSVPDQEAALREFRRVLRPGGELRFLEHVRSQRPRRARVQGVFDRTGIWPRMIGGCHCGRDTAGAIRAAGFEIERMRDFGIGPSCGVTYPHVLGTARPGLPSAA